MRGRRPVSPAVLRPRLVTGAPPGASHRAVPTTLRHGPSSVLPSGRAPLRQRTSVVDRDLTRSHPYCGKGYADGVWGVLGARFELGLAYRLMDPSGDERL